MDYISFDELLMIQKENESANESLSPVPPHQISKRISLTQEQGKLPSKELLFKCFSLFFLFRNGVRVQHNFDKTFVADDRLTLPHQIPKLIRHPGYVKERSLDREEEEEKANACPCYDCNKKKIQ